MKSCNEEISKQLLIYPTKIFTLDEIGNLISIELKTDEITGCVVG